MDLQINRYGVTVPTALSESGLTISVPFYINPTTDQKKQLLNAFRAKKQEQLIEMGHSSSTDKGSLVVVDATQPPQTPIEEELGMNEENLRMALFSRQGLQERLVIKLQNLTGVTLFERDDVRKTFDLWLDSLYGNDNAGVKKAPKKTTSRAKKPAASKSQA